MKYDAMATLNDGLVYTRETSEVTLKFQVETGRDTHEDILRKFLPRDTVIETTQDSTSGFGRLVQATVTSRKVTTMRVVHNRR